MTPLASICLIILLAGLVSGLLVALGWSFSTDKRLSTRFLAGFIIISLLSGGLALAAIQMTVTDSPRWVALIVTPAIFAISYLWLVAVRLYRQIETGRALRSNEIENLKNQLQASKAARKLNEDD
jgi:ABC-type transport system involved in multi-copper enzyme maturation permease subunit